MSNRNEIVKTFLNLSIATVIMAVGFFIGSLVSVAPPSNAAGSVVGVVDVDMLLEKHPAKSQIEEELNKFQAKELLKLEEYNRPDLTQEERKEKVALQIQINQSIKEKHASLYKPVTDDIYEKTREVGRDIGVEVVLDSVIVLYGGVDLTPAVLDRLEKKF